MGKNIIWLIIGGLIVTFLSGCAGAMPAVPWKDFKSKNTQIPGGVRNNTSLGGVSGGVEVHEEKSYEQDKLIITPFFGKESPDYNSGRRDEKENARILKEDRQMQLAIDLAREHAAKGYMSFVGVPGKYYSEYEEAYEYFSSTGSQENFDNYRRSEYERGVNDYRAKNPEYGNFAQGAEQLETKARADAQAFRYELPRGLSPELERVYYEAFMSEVKFLVREKARRDAKMEIFDPPYDIPDFVEYYEMVYQKEIRRSNGRRR